MNDGERSIHLSPVQVFAGALASITAAVLASFFGVAGTVIGAGVVSAAGSVGSALYSYWIRSTNRAIRESIPAAFRQQGSTVRTLVGSGARVSGGSSGVSGIDGAGSDPDNTNEVPDLRTLLDVPPPGSSGSPPSLGPPPTASPPPAPRRREGPDVRSWIEGLWPAALRVGRSLRWRNIALGTVVVFILSMGVVTAVEALAKKPLSGIVGGSTAHGATTSFGGIVGGGRSSRTTPTAPSTPSGSTPTTPQTTVPNGSSPSTTSPSSTPSTTPGRTTTTTSPTPTSLPITPGSTGTTPGSSGPPAGGTSFGSSSGTSASGSGSGTSESGGSSTGG